MCNKGYDNKEHGCKIKCHCTEGRTGVDRNRINEPVLLTAGLIDSVRIYFSDRY